jgi:hypothetical protein
MTDTTVTTTAPAPSAAAAPAAAPPAASPAPAARQGVIADNAYQRLAPADQARYAQVRAGPDGGSEWVERSTLPSATDSPSTVPADPGKPADPLAKVKIGDMEVSQAELQEFFQAKGEADLRKASLPPTANDYVPTLPANFELPAGVDFNIDAADPMLADARAWAHGKGLSQSDFSELIGIYATGKGHEQAFINTATAAEVAKMGINGVQRVTALETWLRGMVGDKLAGPMKQMLATADIVRGMEMIQHRMTTQGTATFSQAHREPGHDQRSGRVSDETYRAMSPGERLDYARGFDQSQFQR